MDCNILVTHSINNILDFKLENKLYEKIFIDLGQNFNNTSLVALDELGKTYFIGIDGKIKKENQMFSFVVWHLLAICTVIAVSFLIGYSVAKQEQKRVPNKNKH